MGKKKDKIRALRRDIKDMANKNAILCLQMEGMVDESELALIHEAYAEMMRPLEEELRSLRANIVRI